uniref:Uncharacterized protein n=1 Tax=Macaca fascicularis TaxID=9541 RepID=A0A7N9CN85_MACFA
MAGCSPAFPRKSNWDGREVAGRLREDSRGVREPAGGQMGRAGNPAAGVRAAAEAAGEHGEPAAQRELLHPVAAPGQQGGVPQDYAISKPEVLSQIEQGKEPCHWRRPGPKIPDVPADPSPVTTDFSDSPLHHFFMDWILSSGY